jgi:hypothetical protein
MTKNRWLLLTVLFLLGALTRSIFAQQVTTVRSGFACTGALPLVVTVRFGTDFTLNTLSAVVGQT